MGRKNTNARERLSTEDVAKMVKRLNKENNLFKAHSRKDEFSMSYAEWLESKERIRK